jgi:hypothetical protein
MVFVAGKLATYLRLLKSRPFHEWPKYGREKFHSLWQMAHEADERSEGQQVLYRDYVTYATFHAAARYVFKTYRGRVLNVIASRRSLSEATRDTRLVFAAEAAPGSRTVTVAAEDSGRLFMPPHVQELAGYLEAFWSLEGCPDAAKPASSSNQSSEAA